MAVAWIIEGVFTGIVGLAVVAGLVRMVLALRQGDTALLRQLAFLILRISLVLAGSIVLMATRGHNYRDPWLLLMGFCALQLVAGRPSFKAFLVGGPRHGAA